MQLLNANILKIGLEINDNEGITNYLASINKYKITRNNKTYCVEFKNKNHDVVRLLTIENAIKYCTHKNSIINYDRLIIEKWNNGITIEEWSNGWIEMEGEWKRENE